MSRRRTRAKRAAAAEPSVGSGETLVLDAHVLNDYLLIEALASGTRTAAATAERNPQRGPRWQLVDAILQACPRIAWSKDLAKQVPIAASGAHVDGRAEPIPVASLWSALNRLKARKKGVLDTRVPKAGDLQVTPPFPSNDEFLARLAWESGSRIIVTEDFSHDGKRAIPAGVVTLTRRGVHRSLHVVDVADAFAIIHQLLQV